MIGVKSADMALRREKSIATIIAFRIFIAFGKAGTDTTSPHGGVREGEFKCFYVVIQRVGNSQTGL